MCNIEGSLGTRLHASVCPCVYCEKLAKANLTLYLVLGKIPIIGVGGVFTGRDAYEKIIAGASLVQIYTSMSCEGPPVIRKIKSELADILRYA